MSNLAQGKKLQVRAVLCGYYGQGNGGDEALLASVLQMLPSEVEPFVLSGDPAATRARYGVKSGARFSPATILKALRVADIFIWGGGSLMQDVTSWTSPLYYGGLMGLAQQMGLETIAWAQGIGPLQRSLTRAITKKVLQNCTAVTVRDRASAQLVSQWQIPCVLAPDPVWALEAKPVPELQNLPIPRVALTLRPHPQLTPQRLHNLTQALIDFQAATGTFILLVPFQPSQDLAIAQAIAPKLKASHICCLEDPRQLKGLFRGVDMVIGMRLHSLIMAAAEGSRCFALSYDPKVSQLMEQVELPGWELAQLPDSPHLISRTWREEYAHSTPLSCTKINSWVEKAALHQEVLSKTVNKAKQV